MKLRNRFATGLLAMAVIMGSLSGQPTVVKAAENETDLATEYSVEAKEQEPVEITEFSVQNEVETQNITNVDISAVEEGNLISTMADARTVLAGTASDYLSQAGEAKIYSLNLPAGVYLQAQLTTPKNVGLDYDLYLLDADGNILCGSEYFTQINGTDGTLPEALGYITPSEATYYLYVLASVGGSISEAYTLDYSICDACDSYEIDEYASQALSFTYGTDGAYVESRNLSSPIDNDWFVINVPSSRIYNKLSITATTASSNTCAVEVYRNVSSSGYQMQKVSSSGGIFSVSTGTYYIRIRNAKSMNDYNDTDIQNYKLSITPILSASQVIITDLNGSEGMNKVVNYPGFGAHFRTQGSGTLTIYGYALATDPATGVQYYVSGTKINGLYYSPSWENNNTAANARRTGSAMTDSTGRFTIPISIPNAIGTYTYDSGVSYHYFDQCGVSASLDDNGNISDSEIIFHLAYTMYHPH